MVSIGSSKYEYGSAIHQLVRICSDRHGKKIVLSAIVSFHAKEQEPSSLQERSLNQEQEQEQEQEYIRTAYQINLFFPTNNQPAARF
jgi:hypothetical protein